MGVGHVTRCDVERVCDETSGIGPGPSGRRDGVGTGCGMSHNNASEHLGMLRVAWGIFPRGHSEFKSKVVEWDGIIVDI